jgi:hypothetical protein
MFTSKIFFPLVIRYTVTHGFRAEKAVRHGRCSRDATPKRMHVNVHLVADAKTQFMQMFAIQELSLRVLAPDSAAFIPVYGSVIALRA